MMAWEKPYMEACIDALQPFGDVLEIGFGCGFSARHIQTYFPKSHAIIECHPQVIAKAKIWAAMHPGVRIIEDTWQNALSSLGVFDAIFFDDYPLETEEEMNQLIEKKNCSSVTYRESIELLQNVHKTLPALEKMIYSYDDVFAFFVAQKEQGEKALARFLSELIAEGKVNAHVAMQLCSALQAEGIFLNLQHQKTVDQVKGPFDFNRNGDRFFAFLQKCLSHHMRKGSRFSCYLNDPTTKYEDKLWFEHIITNPFLDFEERRISVEVPTHCDYYEHTEALVITITKKSD
jgi:predicted O-methyltransferase YrrM